MGTLKNHVTDSSDDIKNTPKKFAWRGKSYGGYSGNLCFLLLLSVGMKPAYALLLFVVTYFMFFRRSACSYGAQWLSKVFGREVRRVSAENWKLLYSFGVTLLDKTAFLSGNKKIICDDCECSGKIKNIIGQSGLVVVTSHVGAWEMSGSLLGNYGREVGILGASGENEKIAKLLNSGRLIKEPKIIGDTSDIMSMLPAYTLLKKGGIVAMHADRYSGGRYCWSEFFGSRVKAPTSAYILAAKAGVPVLQTVCARIGKYKYKVFPLEVFYPKNSNPSTLDKQAEFCSRKFFFNLENFLKKYPYQWFNFYDFWEVAENKLASDDGKISNSK